MESIKNIFTNLVESVRYLVKAKVRIAALKLELKALENGVKLHTSVAMNSLGKTGAVRVDNVVAKIGKDTGKATAPGYKQLIEALTAYDPALGMIAQDEADKLLAARALEAAEPFDTLVLETITPDMNVPTLDVVNGQAFLTA